MENTLHAYSTVQCSTVQYRADSENNMRDVKRKVEKRERGKGERREK